MKTLIAASMMCAYSTLEFPPINPPETVEYYSKLPTAITMETASDEIYSELEAGTFGKLPNGAATTLLNTKKPAIELALKTRKGGEAGFLAMLEALRLSGISINAGSLELASEPSRDQGLSFPYWYLQILSRGENFEANLGLNDLALGLSKVTNVPSEIMLKALQDDFKALNASTDKGTIYFVNYLNGLSNMNSGFNSLQLGLLWLRLEAELVVRGNSIKRFSTPDFNTNCDSTSKDLVKKPELVKKNSAFGETIKITESYNSDSPANAKRSLDRLVNFIKAHSGVMKAFTASYRSRLVGTDQLVRTKTKTNGEKRNYEVQFVPKLKDSAETQCLSALAYSAGVQMKSDFGKDFLKGTKVDFTLHDSLGQERIAFELGQSTNKNFRAEIGDNGVVKSTLVGLAQTKTLSPQAKAVELKVPMKVEFNLSVLEYLSPVDGRDESNVVDALLAMEKLQEKNKKKSFMVAVPVRDWMEKPEGQLSFTINGQDSKNSGSLNANQYSFIATSGAVNSKLTFTLGPQTTLNPGFPPGMPLPPGFPPEMANPSLVIMDEGSFDLNSNIRHDIISSGVCDICRPEDGEYNFQAEHSDIAVAKNAKANPGLVFMGPMQIDRKTMMIKSRVMISIFQTKLTWYKKLDGKTCPGVPSGPPATNGSKVIDHMPKQMIELEIPFTEKDGVIVVKSSYEVPFDYALETHQFPYKIPATLYLNLDMKIPMP